MPEGVLARQQALVQAAAAGGRGQGAAIFANNEAGLQPGDVYGGPSGAIAQLQQLAAWFQVGWLPALTPGAPRNS